MRLQSPCHLVRNRVATGLERGSAGAFVELLGEVSRLSPLAVRSLHTVHHQRQELRGSRGPLFPCICSFSSRRSTVRREQSTL